MAQIRSEAVATSHYEYIIQVDGDVILHRSFIKDYIGVAKVGHVVAGSRAINKSLSNQPKTSPGQSLRYYKSQSNKKMAGRKNYFD